MHSPSSRIISLRHVALVLTVALVAAVIGACTQVTEPTTEPTTAPVQQAQPTATASQPIITPSATTTPPTATPDTRSLQNIPTVSGTVEATATSAPVLGNSPVAVPTPTLRPNESWRSEVSYVRINSTVRASLYDAFSGVISTRLNYEVISTDENIARATVEGHPLRYVHVTGVGRGKATMTVTANCAGWGIHLPLVHDNSVANVAANPLGAHTHACSEHAHARPANKHTGPAVAPVRQSRRPVRAGL